MEAGASVGSGQDESRLQRLRREVAWLQATALASRVRRIGRAAVRKAGLQDKVTLANLEVERAWPLPSRQYMVSFEAGYRLRLPPSFHDFLEEFNGAVFADCARIMVGGREALISQFLPIVEDASSLGDEGRWVVGVVLTRVDGLLSADQDKIGADVLPISRWG